MYLITRADWDGLICALFLSIVEALDRIEFAHPRDMQTGNYPVEAGAIIANLPHHPKCALWFDHHASEGEMAGALEKAQGYHGRFTNAPSAARVIYDYYHDPRLEQYTELLVATDKYDSAHLSMNEVLNPQGYLRLAYTMDPRTHLSEVDWKTYFFHLLQLLKDQPLNAVLADPKVLQMLEQLRAEDATFQQALRDHSRVAGNLVITDFRGLDPAPVGNRFLVHALYPGTNIAARLFNGRGSITVLSLGHSIFKRDCKTHVGELLSRYGGGGHKGAGTVQLYPGEAEANIEEILGIVRANG